MYTSEAKYERDRTLFLVLCVLGGTLPIGTVVTGDIAWGYGAPWVAVVLMIVSLRILMRCTRCKRSVLWWAVTNVRSADFWRVATTTKACPYCGFNGRDDTRRPEG